MNERLIQRALLGWGVFCAIFAWGYFAAGRGLFPANVIRKAQAYSGEVLAQVQQRLPSYYLTTKAARAVTVLQPTEMSPGLTLVTGIGPNDSLMAKLVYPDGSTAHNWDIDWFKMWPNPSHLPPAKRPKAHPGTDIHGAVLSPNGDLTFLFSDLGMAQVDICGRVKWRLPRMTHHTVTRDEAGHFWTLDVVKRLQPDPSLPNIHPPYRDVSVLEVSPTGQVLRAFSVFKLLQENGLQGLLYLSPTGDDDTSVRVDATHVNDVDVFPASMAPGIFKPGDVMVSARNANLVFVFDPATRKIKDLVIGRFVRQHDPDFLDGSTITVFDNNNVGAGPGHESSRIVRYSFATRQATVLFEGNAKHPFYSYAMGKHQLLPNGDLLVSEAMKGRAIEVTPDDKVVWEYNNLARPGVGGLLTEATRLPPSFLSEQSLRTLETACGKAA